MSQVKVLDRKTMYGNYPQKYSNILTVNIGMNNVTKQSENSEKNYILKWMLVHEYTF